jgi:type IV pilus assembly protein PilB
MIKKKLGEILLEEKVLSEDDLMKALAEQKKYGERLGKVLVNLGFITEKNLIDRISKQLGIQIVVLDDLIIPQELIDLMPGDLAKSYVAIPVRRRQGVLQIAMVDPLDINAIDEIAKTLKAEVVPAITTEAEMKRALEKHYGAKTIVEKTLEQITVDDADEVTVEERDNAEEGQVSINMAEQEPVIRFVNSLLAQAIADGASDIHIEPAAKKMRVRMRIDGRLREVPSPDKKMFLPIISRVKILSGMDIAKTRIPQDGRFNIRERSKEIGLRVSSFPTIYGEKVVMRLLDKSAALLGIDRLGFLPADEEKMETVLKRPYGFILSTGPTGSGKSTSLYAILNHLNSVEKNIITMEDPVEYTVDGLAQAQINPRAGLTFESGLRSILRQDPDIIMVGEIRDKETATMAIHCALTGHIVLSTLHTNDAAGAVTRLVEMGIEPFLVTSSVSCVIGQRLLRKICIECKEPYEPSEAILKSYGFPAGSLLYRGKGCASCKYTGYRGRTGIFEVIVLDDSIKDLVVAKSSAETLKRHAIEHGMTTMYEDGMKKVLLGWTTLEEALSAAKIE